MSETRQPLRPFLTALLTVGAIGFGGGPALIPVVEKELVTRRGLLSRERFTTHAVIANITPGAVPVKLGALAGASLGRVRAAVLGALAVALPGALATVALLATFAAVGPGAIRFVEYTAVGISAFIMVLMGNYIAKTLRVAGRRFWVFVAVMAVSFAVTGLNKFIRLLGWLVGAELHPALPELGALGLIVGAIVLIGLYTMVRPGQKHSAPDPVVASGGRVMWVSAAWCGGLVVAALVLAWVFAGFTGLQFIGLTTGSTLSSFGGGAAYIGVADGFFVHGAQLVNPTEFYGQIVPVANAMPGPILVKIAAGLGYSYGLSQSGVALAVLFSVLALTAAVASCSGVALLVLGGYDRFAHSVFLRRLGFYIMPVICGLLLTTSCAMVLENVSIGARAGVPGAWLAWGTLLGVAVLVALQRLFNLGDLALLAIGGVTSLALLATLA